MVWVIYRKTLKKDFIFIALGKKFYFKHGIEGSYNYLLIGHSNEPETHKFLARIIPYLKEANFIDVGASIREFVIGTSRFNNIQNIYAFEPRHDCAMVLRKNAELNNETRITIFENAVSDKNDTIQLYLNSGGTSSGIYTSQNQAQSINVDTVMLDSILPAILQNCIMLIDVEGAEPLVMKGGLSFIERNEPLIIFEYNNTSKKHFSIEDIKSILGNRYSFYRLKSDGGLDQNFSNSWNAVAIPCSSIFHKILFE